MQKKLPDYQISSADIRALAGKDADFRAIRTALKHGAIAADHTTYQLTARMCEQVDLILVMKSSQVDTVADIHPSAHSKTMLSTQWLPKKAAPDSCKQSSEMFEAVFEQLNAAADTWKIKLNGKTQSVQNRHEQESKQ